MAPHTIKQRPFLHLDVKTIEHDFQIVKAGLLDDLRRVLDRRQEITRTAMAAERFDQKLDSGAFCAADSPFQIVQIGVERRLPHAVPHDPRP